MSDEPKPTDKSASDSASKPSLLGWLLRNLDTDEGGETWVSKFLARGFVASLGLVVFFAVLAIGISIFFPVYFYELGVSSDPEDWGKFAGFLGFASQAVLGAATLFSLLLVSVVFTRRADRQRIHDEHAREKERARDQQAREDARIRDERDREEQRNRDQQAREEERVRDQQTREAQHAREQQTRELIRLSEKLVDTEFYVKVVLPSWEVAQKWFEPENHAYRAQVVRGEFRFPICYDGDQSKAMLAEPILRRHPHFLPYDRPATPRGKTAVIGELSESLALATWIRFWRNVAFLIDRDLLDVGDARSMLREWYMWWAPFMTELMAVCQRIENERAPITAYPTETSFADLRRLHEKFEISPFCGSASEGAFADRIAGLVAGMESYLPVLDDATRIDSQL